MSRAKNLLITGRPGVGKSTVIEKVARRLGKARVAGFVTAEIRNRAGRRTGFRAKSFDGRSATIASVDFAGPPRVSKYGVDVQAVDRFSDETLAPRADVDVYLIDEIGKMEVCSERFVEAVERLLDSSKPVVATIGKRGPGLIASAKRRSDVELWEVTETNRDELPERILEWLER